MRLKDRIKKLEARLPENENSSEDLSKELNLLYAALLKEKKKEPYRFWFETKRKYKERLERYKKELLADKEI